MSDVPYIADSLLIRLKGFIDKEVRTLHSKMKTMYAAGERDGTELSLVLAEINCLERLVSKLESEAKKSQQSIRGVINGNPT